MLIVYHFLLLANECNAQSIDHAVGQYGAGKVSGDRIEVVCEEGYSLSTDSTDLYFVCDVDGIWFTSITCNGKAGLSLIKILQSPPTESIHLQQSQVLKTEGGQRKKRACVTLTTELVQTGKTPVWNSRRWRHKNKKFDEFCNFAIYLKRVSSWFLLVCSHFFEFQNEAWPNLEQLNGGVGAPRTFHLPPLNFEYLARQKCILSFGGDCILTLGQPAHKTSIV